MEKKRIRIEDKYILQIVLMSLIFFAAIASITWGVEEIYGTIRERYYWIGTLLILILLFCAQGRDYFIRRMIIMALASAGVCAYVIVKYTGSPHLIYWYGLRGISLVVFIEIVIFEIVKMVEKKENSVNYITLGLFLAVAIGAMIIRPGGCHFFTLIVPFSAFYFMAMSKEFYKRFMISLMIGYICAFLFFSVKSLLLVPITADRYYGVFTTLGDFGIFTFGAFLCEEILLIYLLSKEGHKLIKWLVCGTLLAYTFVLGLLVFTFTSVVGTIVTNFVLIAVVLKKKNKKYLLGYLLCLLFLIIGGGLILLWINSLTYSEFGHYVGNKFLYSVIQSIKLRLERLEWTEAVYVGYDIFDGRIWMNQLDGILGGRLCTWYPYYKNLNFWGHQEMGIPVDYVTIQYIIHPHSNYLGWLYCFGLIYGIILIVAFFALFFGMWKRVKDDYLIYFPGVIWMLYCIIAGLTEFESWQFPVFFVSLFFMRGLFRKRND